MAPSALPQAGFGHPHGDAIPPAKEDRNVEAPVPDLRMTSTSDLSFLEMEIEASGIVDPAWYLEQYPDIRLAGDRERLEQGNYLSMSVVMHDRSVTDIIGGFDED